MSFYSRWQPLIDEDRHTALVFGYLRHAPTVLALDPWLTDLLSRPVAAQPLEPDDFWPNLASVVPGSITTVPELVFQADDGEPLTVVVEVKPGYDMHTLDQIAREVVDVGSIGAVDRICCIMVGADLGQPASTREWERPIADRLSAAGVPVSLDIRYSSFARLGKAIRESAVVEPSWARYAEDVLAQLHRKGLLGYEGAPMLDDIEHLTPVMAVEAFNRVVRAARQFFLQLHGQPAFAALGLEHELTGGYTNPRMLRDGRSESVTEREALFETTLAYCIYRHPQLPASDALFAGFDFRPPGLQSIDLITGASRASFRRTSRIGSGMPWHLGSPAAPVICHSRRRQARSAGHMTDGPGLPRTPTKTSTGPSQSSAMDCPRPEVSQSSRSLRGYW